MHRAFRDFRSHLSELTLAAGRKVSPDPLGEIRASSDFFWRDSASALSASATYRFSVLWMFSTRRRSSSDVDCSDIVFIRSPHFHSNGFNLALNLLSSIVIGDQDVEERCSATVKQSRS